MQLFCRLCKTIIVLVLMLAVQTAAFSPIHLPTSCISPFREVDSSSLSVFDLKQRLGLSYAARARRRRFIASRVAQNKQTLDNFLEGCRFVYTSWKQIVTKIMIPLTASRLIAHSLLWGLRVTWPGVHTSVLKMGLRLAVVASIPPDMYFGCAGVAFVATLIAATLVVAVPWSVLWFSTLFGFGLVKTAFRIVLPATVGSSSTLASLSAGGNMIINAPIIEEILFRFGCDRFGAFRKNNDKRADGTRPKGRRAELCFGLLFGAAHISNHISRDLLVSSTLSSIPSFQLKSMLSLAWIQSANAFLLSKTILFPIYHKCGLMGAIGAHMTWNSLVAVMAEIQMIYFRMARG